MKRIALAVGMACLLSMSAASRAEIGTVDDVPAATLLLPYFEVDLGSDTGVTTLFSVNNASATAVVAHVTMWTDESVPSLDFDIYLTGYDVQTINLRDIFNGYLPRTADAGSDPGDTISNKGSLSQDINFPGSTGPCGSGSTVYGSPSLSSTLISHIRELHTGGLSPVYLRCGGFNHGDDIARGYITVDTVTQCNLSFPSDPGYFVGIASFQNVLWGDYFYVNQAQDFAQGETLVHIEACNPGGGYVGYVGNGAGNCPFLAGDYTFYGRYVAGTGLDQRESLATTWASRYVDGGAFDGGTDFIVWRDSKTASNLTGFSCGSNASWFPLNQADVVAFDEEENPTDLCFQGDNISPPTGGVDTCFPLEAQRVSVVEDLAPPADFGWMYLNLNTTVAGGLFNPTAQAFVTTVMDASGRFSVGYDGIALDNANATFQSASPGGVLLLP